jgi:hypothetical protein
LHFHSGLKDCCDALSAGGIGKELSRREPDNSHPGEFEKETSAQKRSRLLVGVQEANLRQTLASQGCCSRGRPAGR